MHAEKGMTMYEIISTSLSLGTFILIALTLYVYWRILQNTLKQTTAMQQQVAAVTDGARGQNILAVINYIQQEQFRLARSVVISNLESKQLQDWTTEDKTAASKVCSSYDVMGILVQAKMIPEDIVFKEWGLSIIRTHKILSDFITSYRQNMGETYWDDFPRLALQAEKWNSGSKE